MARVCNQEALDIRRIDEPAALAPDQAEAEAGDNDPLAIGRLKAERRDERLFGIGAARDLGEQPELDRSQTGPRSPGRRGRGVAGGPCRAGRRQP